MARNQRDESSILDRIILQDSAPQVDANGTNTVTISNVAPSGVGTATISKWMVVFVGETKYFIPMWT